MHLNLNKTIYLHLYKLFLGQGYFRDTQSDSCSYPQHNEHNGKQYTAYPRSHVHFDTATCEYEGLPGHPGRDG